MGNTLRLYQQDIAQRAADIVNELGWAYLAMEVRTGKTLTALHVAALLRSREVLFVTKKKAIGASDLIIKDRYTAGPLSWR
jgi:superfamily II DNA or RNA helicase